MSTTIISSFDTIDYAENAARIIKANVKDLISISLVDNRKLTEEPAYTFNMFPAPFFTGTTPYQNQQVYAPFVVAGLENHYDSDHDYFEPRQRSDTLLKISIADETAQTAENLLRSLGGQKISVHTETDPKK